MLLMNILDHDLHRSRKSDVAPLWIETPAKSMFLPAVVSGSGMDIPERRFLVSRRLTQDDKIRSGVFKYDSDRIDEIIGYMMFAAYELSKNEGWLNIFVGKDQITKAFGYVQNASGMVTQPHICLVPEKKDLTDHGIKENFVDGTYRKVCKVYSCKVDFPVFCSRPDFVGMYTQFMGGRSSVVLHNVKNGLAFCPTK